MRGSRTKTKAILENSTIDLIVDYMTDRYHNIEVVETHDPSFYIMAMEDRYDNSIDTLAMEIFIGDTSTVKHGIPGILIELNNWGRSVDIAKYLLDIFGGYLLENDSLGDFSIYNKENM
jgi:uncharacterized HAD superfamily protein